MDGPHLSRDFLPDPHLFASAIGMLANSKSRGSGSPYGYHVPLRAIACNTWKCRVLEVNFRR